MNQRPQIPFTVDVAEHCYFEDCTHIKNYLSIYIRSRNYILFNKVLIHFDKILGKIVVVEPEALTGLLKYI